MFRISKSWPLFVLLATSLWVRIYIFQVMHPVFHTDSVTFLFLGKLNTVRTPGYPFLIELLLSVNDLFSFSAQYFRVICFGQIFILGMLNVWLIYRLTVLLTRNRVFALVMGLLYNANFLVISFEFQLMTETLTITLLLAVLVIHLQVFKGRKFTAVIAGVLMVLLIYTKPTYLLLGFFFPILTFVGFFPQSKRKKFLKKLGPVYIVFLTVSVVGIVGYSLRNQLKFGYFGISSLMPYQLRYYTNHLFEKYKPTKDETLNRVAQVYAEEIKRSARTAVNNFHARLKKELGLSDAEISVAFLKVNLKLIKDYPLEYLKQIPDSFFQYYRQYSSYWAAGNARKFLRKRGHFNVLYRNFFLLYKKLFINPYLLTILIVIMPLVVLLRDRRIKKSFHGWLSLELVIHYTCFVSVLSTNAGINNLRYRIPVEPLILLVFFTGLFYCGKGLNKFLRKTLHNLSKKDIP
jgi:hypothetical protein